MPPPPPIPTPPEPSPPASFFASLTFQTNGTLEDFDASQRSAVLAHAIALTGLHTRVMASLAIAGNATAQTVSFSISFELATAGMRDDVAQALSDALATPADASAALGVTVDAVPTVATTAGTPTTPAPYGPSNATTPGGQGSNTTTTGSTTAALPLPSAASASLEAGDLEKDVEDFVSHHVIATVVTLLFAALAGGLFAATGYCRGRRATAHRVMREVNVTNVGADRPRSGSRGGGAGIAMSGRDHGGGGDGWGQVLEDQEKI